MVEMPARMMSDAMTFDRADVSRIAAAENVIAVPAISYPPPLNVIARRFRPLMSFVKCVTAGPFGNVSSAAASPAGEPPAQFAEFENRPSAAPVQTCDEAKSGTERRVAKKAASARVFMRDGCDFEMTLASESITGLPYGHASSARRHA